MARMHLSIRPQRLTKACHSLVAGLNEANPFGLYVGSYNTWLLEDSFHLSWTTPRDGGFEILGPVQRSFHFGCSCCSVNFLVWPGFGAWKRSLHVSLSLSLSLSLSPRGVGRVCETIFRQHHHAPCKQTPYT